MARSKLSLPHERRKAQLKAGILNHRIAIATHKEKLQQKRDELQAMRPKKDPLSV